jgi:predicted kinase
MPGQVNLSLSKSLHLAFHKVKTLEVYYSWVVCLIEPSKCVIKERDSLKLGIMCGMPLSGKSTYCKILQSQGWVRVSLDDLRLALHGEIYKAEAEPLVWESAELMVRSLLKSGHKVVVDTTNRTRDRRKRWIRVAKEYGLTLKIYLVDTDYETCKLRNKSEKRLSQEVLKQIYKEFEIPDSDEGKIKKVNG